MLNSIFWKEISLDLSRVFLNDIEKSHFLILHFSPKFSSSFPLSEFSKSQGPKWRYMIVFLVKNQLDCADILSAVWLIKSYYHFSNFLLCTVGQNWKNSVINRAFLLVIKYLILSTYLFIDNVAFLNNTLFWFFYILWIRYLAICAVLPTKNSITFSWNSIYSLL